MHRPTLLCLLPAALFAAAQHSSPLAAAPQAKAEILWDTYEVPHIFAKDNASLFRAFGYAQMHSHGDLILRLYGQARGRAAELWGEKYIESDRWVRTNGIPQRAQEWYRAQSPEFRRYLDAFAGGVNEYGRLHGDRLASDVRSVLPVTASDVFAHLAALRHLYLRDFAGSRAAGSTAILRPACCRIERLGHFAATNAKRPRHASSQSPL